MPWKSSVCGFPFLSLLSLSLGFLEEKGENEGGLERFLSLPWVSRVSNGSSSSQQQGI